VDNAKVIKYFNELLKKSTSNEDIIKSITENKELIITKLVEYILYLYCNAEESGKSVVDNELGKDIIGRLKSRGISFDWLNMDYLIDIGVVNKIKTYIKKLTYSNLQFFFTNTISPLCKYPKLKIVFENLIDSKKDIILNLLNKEIITSSTVLTIFAVLRKLNIHWPEMDDIFSKIKDSLYKRIINYISSNSMWKIMELEKEIQNAGYNLDKSFDIVDIANKNKESILNAIITKFVDEGSSINYVIDIVKTLKSLGIEWSEFENPFESNKDLIIKILLYQINKNNVNIKSFLAVISKLNSLGIEWPELTVIKNSIESDMK